MNVFLFCAMLFVLSFAAIWAIWFIERMRGDGAPKVTALVARAERD